MIKKITSIEDIGILGNGASSDFLQYNLIYGKNGCGKSTFSKIFEEFETKGALEEGKCKVNSEIGTHQLPRVGDEAVPIVRVFNQSFIKKNLDWDSLSKAVLILSTEKIEDTKKLEEQRSRLTLAEKELVEIKKNADLLVPKLSLPGGASDIKERFKTFRNRSFPAKYNTYSVREFRPQIEAFSKMHTPIEVLNLEAYEKYFSILNTNIGSYSTLDQAAIFEGIVEKLKVIEEQSAKVSLSGKIEKILQDQDLAKWIEDGLGLHEHEESCLFCENSVSQNRLDQLRAHFDKSLSDYHDSVDAIVEELSVYDKSRFNLLVASFLPQFQEKFVQCEIESEPEIEKVIIYIADVSKKLIQSKTTGKFTLEDDEKKIDLKIDTLNKNISSLNELIVAHNAAITNFLSNTQIAAENVEFYLTWNWCANSTYFKFLSEYEMLSNQEASKKQITTALKDEISRIEGSLSKEITGANKINTLLEKFIPHKELQLSFDSTSGGYRILREGKEIAGRLSEGEKTAIAFVYFSVKLNEVSEWQRNAILFVDDPISSLDSHNIHNIFAYISLNFGSVKQLFVATHNFHFFKLIRDWMLKKNKRDKTPKSRVFEMRSTFDGTKRMGVLYDAHESLVEFNSEYRTLLRAIHEWSKVDTPCASHGVAIDIANYCRKCLESFISFKFGRLDNFRNDLVDNKSCLQHLSAEELLRIYSFVNTFSHKKDQFDQTDILDSQFVEGYEVAKKVINLINSIDSDHFNAHVLDVAEE